MGCNKCSPNHSLSLSFSLVLSFAKLSLSLSLSLFLAPLVSSVCLYFPFFFSQARCNRQRSHDNSSKRSNTNCNSHSSRRTCLPPRRIRNNWPPFGRSQGRYDLIDSTVESSAANTNHARRSMGQEMNPTPACVNGVKYHAAGSQQVPDLGQRRFEAFTANWETKRHRF